MTSATKAELTCVDLLVDNIGELVTAQSPGQPLRGRAMHDDIKRIVGAVVAVKDGKVVACGPREKILGQISLNKDAQVIDAKHKLVTPGLIDSHTHTIFAGNRANEFVMRCQGKTYQQIAQAGGGIVASMSATRSASEQELVDLAVQRLQQMLSFGTTTCEIKTGYGLDKRSEMTMLSAAYALNKKQAVEILPTFMPAHAVPTGVSQEAYVDEIATDMLPAVVAWAREQKVERLPFVDVFCDEGYFTLAQTEVIFKAALSHGMKIKVHADEFKSLGATRLAVQMGALSCDHLLAVNEQDIVWLSKSNTIATLLPGTSFFLNLKEHAPARRLIDQGAAVSLASDFNPGSCHISSLPFICGLSCLNLSMTPQESIVALTVNAAFAIGEGHRLGQLQAGYQADLVIYDIDRLEELPYNLASNPVKQVIKTGQLVYVRE